jgi:hypothetical protein
MEGSYNRARREVQALGHLPKGLEAAESWVLGRSRRSAGNVFAAASITMTGPFRATMAAKKTSPETLP